MCIFSGETALLGGVMLVVWVFDCWVLGNIVLICTVSFDEWLLVCCLCMRCLFWAVNFAIGCVCSSCHGLRVLGLWVL